MGGMAVAREVARVIKAHDHEAKNRSRLANYVGVTTSSVSGWVLEKSVPEPENLKLIAEHYGLPTDYFKAIAEGVTPPADDESHDDDLEARLAELERGARELLRVAAAIRRSHSAKKPAQPQPPRVSNGAGKTRRRT